VQSYHSDIFPLILNNLKNAIVFVDNEHIIRYLNAAAHKKYAKYGDIIGKSIFHCHNENSCRMIRDYHDKMKTGADEFLLAEREAYYAYMKSVRSPEGELLGYYEIHEPK
jgi:DUF438 domain-containing protein